MKILVEHEWTVFGTVRPEARSDESFTDVRRPLSRISISQVHLSLAHENRRNGLGSWLFFWRKHLWSCKWLRGSVSWCTNQLCWFVWATYEHRNPRSDKLRQEWMFTRAPGWKMTQVTWWKNSELWLWWVDRLSVSFWLITNAARDRFSRPSHFFQSYKRVSTQGWSTYPPIMRRFHVCFQ